MALDALHVMQSDPDGHNGSTSGNRWEPEGDHATSDLTAQSEPPAYGQPADPARSAAARGVRPAWLTRTRSAVAAGAAAVLLAGGLGGFAIGRATADDGGTTGDQNTGVTPDSFPDGDGDGDRDGDGHGFPYAGAPGHGQLPDPSASPSADDDADGSDT